MTIHKKGTANKTKTKGSDKNVTEVASTSSSSTADVSQSSSKNATVASTEIVSTSSVVQEASKVMKSESRSSVVEVSSSSREVIMDSKGNVVKVIEHAPKTAKHSSSTSKAAQSSTDFIAGEQREQIRQTKKEISDEKRRTNAGKSLKQIQDGGHGTTVRSTKGESTDQISSSHFESSQKASSSSSTVVESSSSVQAHLEQSSSVTSSDQIPSHSNPTIQTSSKSFESARSSQLVEQGVTKDGQTVKSKTEIHKAGHRLNDNGKVTSSKTESVDSETSVLPADGKDGNKTLHTSQNVKVIGERASPDKTTGNVTIRTTVTDSTGKSVTTTEQIGNDGTAHNTKPGASTWDGKFVLEKSVKQNPRNTSSSSAFRQLAQDSPSPKKSKDKRTNVSRTVAGDNKSVTQIQQGSSKTTEVRGSTNIDKKQSSSTVIQDHDSTVQSYTLETVNTYDSTGKLISSVTRRVPSETSAFTDSEGRSIDQQTSTIVHETDSSDQDTRYSKPGDSAWDGKFVYEKPSPTQKWNTSDASIFQHPGQGGVIESTKRIDSRESNLDGSYNKESTTNVHTARGSTESSEFLTRERVDVSKESYVYSDDGKTPRTVAGPPEGTRINKPGQSNPNGQFVRENPQDNRSKQSTDATVVRRTKPRNDSVEVQDITEEVNVSNVSESVSSSYIVEHSSSSDIKSIDKVTSVSETIIEEEPSGRGTISHTPHNRPVSPDKSRGHPRDGAPVSYKPGQSTWDGHFIYEKPQTPISDRRRPPNGSPVDSSTRRTNRRSNVIDISDVTEDNSINEVDTVSTSYIVEHSSSQQSFTDSKDHVSISSITSERTVYDDQQGSRPGSAQRKHPLDGHPTPSERLGSPDKTTRPTKPGSSTWDGSFLYENVPDQKKPADSKRQPVIGDGKKPSDSRQRPTTENKRLLSGSPSEQNRKNLRHVSDTTLNMDSTVEDEVISSSIIVEQSNIQESFTDSKNLDFSTTVTETVIIRDGKPVEKQTIRSITDEHYPDSPEKRGPSSPDKLINTPGSPHKKTAHPDDASIRPTKPGSSTWDGSFVVEKRPTAQKPADIRQEPRVNDKRKPVDGRQQPIDDGKKSTTRRPSDGKPSDVERRTSKHVSDSTLSVGNTTKDVSSTSEVVTSSFVVERSDIQASYTDSQNVDFSTSSTVIIRDGKPVERHTVYSSTDQYRPGSPDKRTSTPRDKTDGQRSPDNKTGLPDEKTARPTKPGSSTWDGSFVIEKTQGQRKPADLRKEPVVDDQRKPTDGKRQPNDGNKRPSTTKHVSDSTLTLGNTTKDVSSTSDVVTSSSFVVEQSSAHESYRDSKDVNFSTTSTETLLIRDGKPVDRYVTHSKTGQRRPGSPEKKIPLPGENIVDRPESPTKKGSTPEDKNIRPTKPGSSTWDGSFVYEKPQESTPKLSQKKTPTDDKKRPTDVRSKDEKLVDTTSQISTTTSKDLRKTSEDIRDTSDITTSTYVTKQTSIRDSKKFGSTSVAETIVHEESENKQSRDDSRKSKRPEGLEKSPERRPGQPGRRPDGKTSPEQRPGEPENPEDRSTRPNKPGSSTWNGAFVYEHPKEPTSKQPGQKKEPTGDKRRPSDDQKKLTDGRPENRKPTDTVTRKSSTTSADTKNISTDITDVVLTSVSDSKKFGSTVVSETIVYEGSPDNKPREDGGQPKKPDGDKMPQHKPGEPKRRPDGKPHPDQKPKREESPEDRSTRPTKLGSSTWSGAFVYEQPKTPTPTGKKPGQQKEPTDGKKRPLEDKKKPSDERPKDQKITDTVVRKLSTTSTDTRDITEDVTDVTINTYVSEQTSVSDSKKFGSTVISETIVYEGSPDNKPRDDGGQPKKPDGDKMPQHKPGEPKRRTDGKPHPDQKPKREESPEDRSTRPTKLGSSTWSGAFVYEQPKTPTPAGKKPGQQKEPTDGKKRPLEDKKKPSDERPKDQKITDTVVRKLSTTSTDTRDITEDVTDVTINTYVSEQTSVSDSKKFGSTVISETIVYEGSPDNKPRDDGGQPKKPDGDKMPQHKAGEPKRRPDGKPLPDQKPKREESPEDRSTRPTKPGSSTWNGAFVYEQPKEPTSKKPEPKTGPTADKKQPTDSKKKPGDKHPTDSEVQKSSTPINAPTDKRPEQKKPGDSIDKPEKSKNLSEKPGSPSERPDGKREPEDRRPESPTDKSDRPTKPGSSTWDGSFVYEKPKPTEKPEKPADGKKPKHPSSPKDVVPRRHPSEQSPDEVTKITFSQSTIDLQDVTDIQKSSYVIEHSSSYTSVKDVRDITEEYITTDYTTEERHDLRDVTESTTEFIGHEQVTSMVARDVVDDKKFEKITTAKGPKDTPTPKPIPAAGKPSRPQRRDESPKKPGDDADKPKKPKKPSDRRSVSPEKPGDQKAPDSKPKPAAGKPSRPDEKPRRGDQTPDSLDEEEPQPKNILEPADVLAKIPLKEQCICELCTCG